MSISRSTIFYILSIVLGILAGISGLSFLAKTGSIISEIFIKMFRCISMPVISLSVIVALSGHEVNDQFMKKVWKRTFLYTVSTTLIAAFLCATLYKLINPSNMTISTQASSEQAPAKLDYIKYILDIIPDNITTAFSEHKVLSVLLISVIIGVATRFIKDTEAKQTVISFFKGIHSIFFSITRFIVKILPIGLFGFITVSVVEMRHGMDLKGMGGYLSVIALSNVLQGALILPVWLSIKGISPVRNFKAMFPALSVAFFSKTSTGVLPVTIETAEEKLGISPRISRFVLPLCTTINVNGCAIFVFTTVIYIMQNYGVEISTSTMLTWILISTIAATGNAGIPMGCFFLSASLLSSMDIPMPLLGMIIPFYGIIDMLEASLNVWSDSCIASVVNKELSA